MEARFSDAPRIIDAFPAPPGLYVHVPFCSSICPFCPYNKVAYEAEVVSAYFCALQRELDAYAIAGRQSFTSLYIGGGTPSLCIEEIGRMIADIPVEGERAIELLPGHATTARLNRLRDLGINYLSLGIQSFDESVLRYLRRPNSVADNHAALAATVGRFDCVDADLIFDIAFQSEPVFLKDLETCFRAGVDQVSTYPLMRFGYTPFGKARHRSRAEHAVLRAAEELAGAYGYERRAVWTFARRASANYSSITREFYLGCGAGAASYAGRLFLLNHFAIPAYMARINAGELPIARKTVMSRSRAAAYYLFWQTYTGTIDLDRFDTLFPGRRILRAGLRTMVGLGLLQRVPGGYSLTPSGYDHYHRLERWVTYHLIEPLWADMMREHEHLRGAIGDAGRAEQFWLQLTGLQS